MGIALDATEDSNLICLEGAVDISCAAELKKMLLESLGSGKRVCIQLEKATYLDVTAVELIWAAEREARNSTMEITFAGQLSEQVCSGLASAGFEKFSFQQLEAKPAE